MPILVRVTPPSETGGNASAQPQLSPDTLYRLQGGRTAATKGLLHDFSNVMVGLCSLSENALEETEPGSPLRDDMEIIRDSSVRAHHLIRRISSLNSTDVQPPCLLDIAQWLSGEAETIRAILPKGSGVTMPEKNRAALVTVSETILRDFLLMLVASVARSRPRERLCLLVTLEEMADACLLTFVFSETGTAPGGGCGGCAIPCAALEELAALMKARCECVPGEKNLRVTLAIREQ
jgi:hypothetical protein